MTHQSPTTNTILTITDVKKNSSFLFLCWGGSMLRGMEDTAFTHLNHKRPQTAKEIFKKNKL